MPNALQATPGNAVCSASRATRFGPACLSLIR